VRCQATFAISYPQVRVFHVSKNSNTFNHFFEEDSPIYLDHPVEEYGPHVRLELGMLLHHVTLAEVTVRPFLLVDELHHLVRVAPTDRREEVPGDRRYGITARSVAVVERNQEEHVSDGELIPVSGIKIRDYGAPMHEQETE
jgi:hypothetical protein